MSFIKILDQRLLLWLNSFTGHNIWFDETVDALASKVLPYLLVLALLFLFFYPHTQKVSSPEIEVESVKKINFFKKLYHLWLSVGVYPQIKKFPALYERRRMVVWAFICGIVSRLIFTPIVRFILPRTRAYEYLPVHLIGPFDIENSFPSGHAAFFFAIAFMVYYFDKRLGYIFLSGALLMGLARVVAGIHFPSDIISGILLGWLSSILLKHFFIRTFRSPLVR
jgi:undecaprenyl-diphosphatase